VRRPTASIPRARVVRLRALLPAILVVGTLAVGVGPASAHPLGNFTVNVYTGLRVQPERLVVDLVVDMAEIPTFQARRSIDVDGDDQVSDAEASTYATSGCLEAAGRVEVTAGGDTAPVRSEGAEVTFPPGTAGLVTLRLTCALVADTGPLSEDREVRVRNRNYDDRVGWREFAAVGDRTTLLASDVGPRSISDRLVNYPDDLLQSPPDQRSALVRVRPGGPPAPDAFGPPPGGQAATGSGGAGTATRGVDRATRSFTELVGRRDLTPGLGLLALALSVALGALHALAPGHGKTVMAAYLVGQHGSARQAALIGLTVTATHTTGVLILGIVLSSVTALASEDLYPWLGLASGLLLVAIGVGLLRSALRRRSRDSSREPALVGTSHGHGHSHGHSHATSDRPGHGHPHGPLPPEGMSRRGLVALGLAGGLVPSPSALVVLLSAIALGRAWFGVALVVGYGAGMAATLTGAGLLLVRFRAVVDRRLSTGPQGRFAGVARVLPMLTAGLVLAGGLLLTVRALAEV